MHSILAAHACRPATGEAGGSVLARPSVGFIAASKKIAAAWGPCPRHGPIRCAHRVASCHPGLRVPICVAFPGRRRVRQAPSPILLTSAGDLRHSLLRRKKRAAAVAALSNANRSCRVPCVLRAFRGCRKHGCFRQRLQGRIHDAAESPTGDAVPERLEGHKARSQRQHCTCRLSLPDPSIRNLHQSPGFVDENFPGQQYACAGMTGVMQCPSGFSRTSLRGRTNKRRLKFRDRCLKSFGPRVTSRLEADRNSCVTVVGLR